MTTVSINRREYTVEKTDGERCSYILHGKRGATYGTLRNVNDPRQMFLVNLNRMRVDPIGDVWLTDARGDLEVIGHDAAVFLRAMVAA